jgi:cyclase
MLKTRVIPTLLWNGYGLVKGQSFDSWRSIGAVMPAIKVYNTREVDELILLDINAHREGRACDHLAVADFSAECFVPFTVGGGVQSLQCIRDLLLAGADKVAVNTAAYDRPELIEQAADRFGSQCIVVSIDARRSPDARHSPGGGYECYRNSGTLPTGRSPVAWAREVERRGAGEILITSIERDGTLQGYDLDLVGSVAAAVSIPVIASGGAGTFEHLHQAIRTANASAVAAAAMFHFTQQTPLEAKRYLAARGIPVRDSRSSPAPPAASNRQLAA